MHGENARRVAACIVQRAHPAPPRAPRRRARGQEIPAKWRRGTGVRILSAEVRRSCPRTARGHPGSPCADLSPSSSPLLAAASLALRARSARARRQVTTVELRASARSVCATRGCSAAVHACRRPVARQRPRGVPDTLDRAAAGARGDAAAPEDEDGPDAGSPRAATPRLAARQSVVGRAVESRSRRARSATSRGFRAQLVWSPEVRIPLRVPERDRDAADRAAARRGEQTSRSGAARRPTRRLFGSRSSTTRPAATTTRAPRPPRSSRGSSSSTCRGTAGTTSATTFSSTASGRSTRGASAASTATSSARTRWASTPAPSASRCSGRTGARSRRRRRRTRSPASSPGGSTSRTSIRRRFLTFISGGSERYASGIPGAAERGLGPPRHGLHGVSGKCALLEARRDRGLGSGARRAEDLRPARRTSSGTAIRVRAQALAGTAVDGRDDEPRPARRSRVARAPAPPSTGPGSPAAVAGRRVHLDDRGRHRASRDRRASGRRRRCRRSRSRPLPPSRRRSARTETARRTRRLLTYRITAPANVTVEIADAIGGVIATVVDRVWTQRRPAHGRRSTARARRRRLQRRRHGADRGRRVGSEGRPAAPSTARSALVAVAPRAFSPNGDGRKDSLSVTFSLAAPADVRIRIERDGRWVASPLIGELPRRDADVRLGRRCASSGRFATASTRRSSRRRSEIGSDLVRGSRSSPTRSRRACGSCRASACSRGQRACRAHASSSTAARSGDEAKRAGIVRIPWDGPATSRSRRRLGRCGQRERARRPRRSAASSRRIRPVDSTPCRRPARPLRERRRSSRSSPTATRSSSSTR